MQAKTWFRNQMAMKCIKNQQMWFSVLDLPEERLEFECFYSHIEKL